MNHSETGNSKVSWADDPRERLRVVLLGVGNRTAVIEQAEKLRPTIESYADILLTDFTGSADLTSYEADFAIVIGGDGSILRAARQMGTRQIPVLGINMGKLGFLADLAPEELSSVFPDVCAGKCCVIEHLMFQCQVTCDGKIVKERLGLNEAAILGGPPFSLMNVDLYVDSELATTYSCDGLIISTPVGSTAHNLSAGGPILRKSLDAFVISPISPHTLTVRPVVDSAEHKFEMVVQEPSQETAIVVDGQQLHKITAADRVCVRRADSKFKLIEVPGHGYYRTLREKLNWGGAIQRDVQ